MPNTSTPRPTVDGPMSYDDFLTSVTRNNSGYTPLPRMTINLDVVAGDAAGQPKLDYAAAEEALRTRFRDEFGYRDAELLPQEISDYILLSIPSGALTAQTVGSLDVRPYFANLKNWLDANEPGWQDKSPSNSFAAQVAMSIEFLQPKIDKATSDVGTRAMGPKDTAPVQFDFDPSAPVGLSPTARYAKAAAAAGGMDGSQPTLNPDGTVAPGGATAPTSFADLLAGSSGDTLDRRVVSEQEIRDAMILTRSSDAYDAMTIGANFAGASDSPLVNMPRVQLSDPRAPSGVEDPGGGTVKRSLSVEQAVLYLQRGEGVTPAMVKNMQDKLVKAGYMDGLNGRVTSGDAWDEVTNQAWRKALGDSIMQNIPLPQLLEQQAKQRSESFSPISTTAQQSMLDQVARSVLGRSLDNQEMSHLIAQLYQLKDQPIAAPNADGSGGTLGVGAWYTAGQVQDQLLNDYGGELPGTGAARAVYEGTKLIQGMFK